MPSNSPCRASTELHKSSWDSKWVKHGRKSRNGRSGMTFELHPGSRCESETEPKELRRREMSQRHTTQGTEAELRQETSYGYGTLCRYSWWTSMPDTKTVNRYFELTCFSSTFFFLLFSWTMSRFPDRNIASLFLWPLPFFFIIVVPFASWIDSPLLLSNESNVDHEESGSQKKKKFNPEISMVLTSSLWINRRKMVKIKSKAPRGPK